MAALKEELGKKPELAAMLHYLQDGILSIDESWVKKWLQRVNSTTLLMVYFILRAALFQIIDASLYLNSYILMYCKKLTWAVLQHISLKRKCMTAYIKACGGRG